MELKLKESPKLTFWQKLRRWVTGREPLDAGQLSKIVTLEIPLTPVQKEELRGAIDAPKERSSDTTSFYRSGSGGSEEKQSIII